MLSSDQFLHQTWGSPVGEMLSSFSSLPLPFTLYFILSIYSLSNETPLSAGKVQAPRIEVASLLYLTRQRGHSLQWNADHPSVILHHRTSSSSSSASLRKVREWSERSSLTYTRATVKGKTRHQWELCAYVIVYGNLPPSQSICGYCWVASQNGFHWTLDSMM